MALFKTIARVPSLARHTARLSVPASQLQSSRGYADMAFTFACPAQVHYNAASVKQIDVPSFSGNFGILADHVPTLAVLKPGVVTVYEDEGAVKKFFVSSGSITINEDSSVQILAEEAVDVASLDSHAIRDGYTKAQQEVNSASSDVAKAEAMIAEECYEALSKAIE